MGEIAEDMIDETTCEICGCYFVDPEDDDTLFTHGYPVVCKSCWERLSPAERKFHQKAKVDTL
jgi:hypothetical protein